MKLPRTWALAAVVGLARLLVGCSSGEVRGTTPEPKGAEASSTSQAPSFTLCNGTFALCTTAQCTKISDKAAGGEGFLSCPCDVKQGDSAGQQVCAGVPTAAPYPGQSIPSRYQPVQSMAICTNNDNQPWAWCLDMPCVVDANTAKATCVCVTSAAVGSGGKGDYVVVTDTYNDKTCLTGPNSPNGFISSATVCGVDGITQFFHAKTSSTNAAPIKIVNNVAQPQCPASP